MYKRGVPQSPSQTFDEIPDRQIRNAHLNPLQLLKALLMSPPPQTFDSGLIHAHPSAAFPSGVGSHLFCCRLIENKGFYWNLRRNSRRIAGVCSFCFEAKFCQIKKVFFWGGGEFCLPPPLMVQGRAIPMMPYDA